MTPVFPEIVISIEPPTVAGFGWTLDPVTLEELF